MRELTANYYANNDFTKVIGEIELATEELAQLVGSKVIELAENYYLNPEKEGTDTGIVRKVQRPIALLATLRLYQKNDLSHEDDGRKFKVATDGSEKLPWEWQLDRDDALHLEEYYKAVDMLIRYLNDKELKEWTDSDMYKSTQMLIIRNGGSFDTYFPINRLCFNLEVLHEIVIILCRQHYSAPFLSNIKYFCPPSLRNRMSTSPTLNEDALTPLFTMKNSLVSTSFWSICTRNGESAITLPKQIVIGKAA